MRNDIYGRYPSELGGQEELGSVRDDALDEAGEGIKDTGSLAWVEVILLRDLARDLPCGEDGDGIVSRADIRHGDEGRNSEFGTALAVDTPCEMTQEVVDTTVVADELQHTSSHQRHDDELAHTRDAATECADPVPGW